MGDISSSRSRSRNQSSVWGEQSPFLMDLYQRGANLLNQFQPNTQIPAAAQAAWQQQLTPQMNPYLDQMTSQYTQALGQLDNQTGMGAAGAGVYGGGRQGVEQHLNQQNIGNQVGNFLGSQYQADQARSMTALSMAPQMLGLDPYQQQQGALNNFAGIIGRPTVLGSGSSSGRSNSFGLAGK